MLFKLTPFIYSILQFRITFIFIHFQKQQKLYSNTAFDVLIINLLEPIQRNTIISVSASHYYVIVHTRTTHHTQTTLLLIHSVTSQTTRSPFCRDRSQCYFYHLLLTLPNRPFFFCTLCKVLRTVGNKNRKVNACM